MEEWIKLGFIVFGLTAFVGSGIAWYIGWNCPKCPEYEEEEYDSKNYQDETKNV